MTVMDMTFLLIKEVRRKIHRMREIVENTYVLLIMLCI